MALINKKQDYQDQEDWYKDIEKLKGYKELVEKAEYWSKQKDDRGILVIKGSYKIIWDNELGWCVDVDGRVSFDRLDIKEIPFQFRNVSGDDDFSGNFDCSGCKYLNSLKGCPVYVSGNFNCCGCEKLTSLEGCPKEVGGEFTCLVNDNLTSLEGCPKEVGGRFWCEGCGKPFSEEYIRSICNVKGYVQNGID